MSRTRAMDLQLGLPMNMSPEPNRYTPKVTANGQRLGIRPQTGKVSDQVRGTFGNNERFSDYRINAFKNSNPGCGP